MIIWLVVVLVLVLVAAWAWVFRGHRVIADAKLEPVKNRAQILASAVTAVGIAAAGFLYALEQRWSPRFDVDIDAETFALPGAKPSEAIVHVIVSIRNEGRTSQTIRRIEAGLVGIRAKASARTDENGDYPGASLGPPVITGRKIIGPGETDFKYFDLAVSCDWTLVRVLVKIPQPPYGAAKAGEMRPLYERKKLVPLQSVCGASALAAVGES